MESKTPRTDACFSGLYILTGNLIKVARQLESENAELREALDKAIDSIIDHIKSNEDHPLADLAEYLGGVVERYDALIANIQQQGKE